MHTGAVIDASELGAIEVWIGVVAHSLLCFGLSDKQAAVRDVAAAAVVVRRSAGSQKQGEKAGSHRQWQQSSRARECGATISSSREELGLSLNVRTSTWPWGSGGVSCLEDRSQD